MSEKISIDTDAIEAHARHVDQVADDVRLAVQAAGQTMLSAGAFGLMCSWMIPPFLATAGAATAAMGSTASALDRSARELRGVGTDFANYEEDVIAALAPYSNAIEAM